MRHGCACGDTLPMGASATQTASISTPAGMRPPRATTVEEASVTQGVHRRWRDSILIKRLGLAPSRGILLTLELRFWLMVPSVGTAESVAAKPQRRTHLPFTRQGYSKPWKLPVSRPGMIVHSLVYDASGTVA